MAPYATAADIQERYGEETYLLSFDRLSDGSIDADAVTKALTAATSEINSYVGARYDLPLATVPDILVQYACDIAIYRGSDQAKTLTKEKRKRYEDARDWLKLVAAGKATLGLDEEPVSVGGGPQLITDNDRTWTRGKTRGIW